MKGIGQLWEYIGELREESVKRREKAKTHFSVIEDVYQQLSFFCCPNHVLDPEYQRDISKYVYCNDLGVSPYAGSYDDQPKIWIDKYFTIKNAIQLRESIHRKEIERKNGR
tara:strand:- start:10279 stop:10611 length:333 start_codon:yes stop_codon:yes gene_type:complete